MTVQLRDDVVLNETEYGAILLDQRRGTYWQLNPTGTMIVKALLAEGDVETTARRLVERYDIELDSAREDVRALVAEMRTAGAFR
ncbi:lasso peptide biosynthesis PqqD family chaperone [Actinoplanes aureus]|uniref:Lasso peptide biosynthesis PqqD family chaperone n=1 Tax=Actinoplanes aureus TaxID=2792083 RepID=A0A931CJW7_9ACTN|nr:lasso peptide biosynthesis PqqD family chaperone [Actinoplanes aureus]MBG0567761.1 lasso peptide biosynthesis PqqD family chaperone [Actinoplanes aureus]